ncbi:alpha/beta hydrolase [Desulfopila sp. IMCC35006]|uniref:alpha/beta hydrolase n=1 Tax=Desulfopila sp. IMCC35006 TaxID=2569542 RepID=UPI00142F1873|nr:alpha/beta hydrolase [Desulfopila sp. IMCC35006]
MVAYSKIDQPEILALLFPPLNSAPTPCPAGAEDISFAIGKDNEVTCRFYCTDLQAPVLFYYPAANESNESFDIIAERYGKRGINVFRAQYRVCGENNGSPSVAAMYATAEKLFPLAVDWMRSKGYTGALFVMGESLGSICAIDTVARNGEAVKGMIIESGICGTSSFLQSIGVSEKQADIAEDEGFDNVQKIEKIKVPTLIFHGAKDSLVAVAEAENLQAASGARNKQFFVIPGAEHHNVGKTGGDLFIQAIKQFTDTVCGVNTWRQKRKSYKRT